VLRRASVRHAQVAQCDRLQYALVAWRARIDGDQRDGVLFFGLGLEMYFFRRELRGVTMFAPTF